MTGEKAFKPKKYRCPICGRRATFGTHFCEGKMADEEKPERSKIVRQVGISAIAFVTIVAFLWSMIGAYALYASGAALAIVALVFAARSLPRGKR